MGRSVTLAWSTDPHLPHASPAAASRFWRAVEDLAADHLVLTGDLARADSLGRALLCFSDRAPCPVSFVLGNHDFYGGSVRAVRRRAADLARGRDGLTYLTDGGPLRLADAVALVGQDGWADGRCGDLRGSRAELEDFRLVAELTGLSGPREEARLMQELAGGYADALARDLEEVERADAVVVATHVPPFRAAARHEGEPADADHAPYFASKVTGQVLVEAAESVPGRELLVLCGHSHGGGSLEVRPNLTVWTGAAEYGSPDVQEVVAVGPDGPQNA